MADLIGTTEAAKVCGVERSTFFRWVQLGHIAPRLKMQGDTGALLFDPAEVDALKAEKALRAKHKCCPNCKPPVWHNGDPCPNEPAVAS